MIQNPIFGILFFLKILLQAYSVIQRYTAFLYFSSCSNWHHQSFFSLNFRFSSRKSQSQQNLAKKISHFTIKFRSTILRTSTHLTLKIISSRSTVKSLCDFANFPRHVSVWCQKKYLHCSHSWLPIIVFLKHFEINCLYISIYLLMKIFLLET